MNGTNDTEAAAGRRQPSPFVAEIAGRLHDIASGAAEPWNDPAEKRREALRRDMEITRLLSMEMAVRLNEATAGRLPAWQCEMFKEIKDPLSSLAKLNRSIVQVALAEERFNENAEERAARRVAEAEARARAERAAATARDDAAMRIRRAENRRQTQHAVREITLDGLNLPYSDREKLLDDLFAELDQDPDRYDLDPAQAIAEIASRLGLAPRLAGADKARMAAIAENRTRLVAAARAHLEALRGPHAIDTDDDDGQAAIPTPAPAPAKPTDPLTPTASSGGYRDSAIRQPRPARQSHPSDFRFPDPSRRSP